LIEIGVPAEELAACREAMEFVHGGLNARQLAFRKAMMEAAESFGRT
jgi:hypothetical protein